MAPRNIKPYELSAITMIWFNSRDTFYICWIDFGSWFVIFAEFFADTWLFFDVALLATVWLPVAIWQRCDFSTVGLKQLFAELPLLITSDLEGQAGGIEATARKLTYYHLVHDLQRKKCRRNLKWKLATISFRLCNGFKISLFVKIMNQSIWLIWIFYRPFYGPTKRFHRLKYCSAIGKSYRYPSRTGNFVITSNT